MRPMSSALAGVGRGDGRLHQRVGDHAPVDPGPHVDDSPLRQLVELLDVVEADVLALGHLHRAEPGHEVVDEGGVGDRPGAELERLAEGVGQGGGLLVVEHAARDGVDVLGVGQPQQQLTRVELAPPRREELVDVARGVERVEEDVALALAHRAPGGLGEGRPRGIRGEVVLVAAQHLRPHPAQRHVVEAHGVAGDERAEHVGRTGGRSGGEPGEQPADAQRALDRGDLGGVEPGGGHALDEVAGRRAAPPTPRRGLGSTRSM